MKNLKTLSLEMDRFAKDFALIGTHINNARTKFEDSEKRLTRFNDRLQGITSVEDNKIEQK